MLTQAQALRNTQPTHRCQWTEKTRAWRRGDGAKSRVLNKIFKEQKDWIRRYGKRRCSRLGRNSLVKFWRYLKRRPVGEMSLAHAGAGVGQQLQTLKVGLGSCHASQGDLQSVKP